MVASALARFSLFDWATTPLLAIIWRELLTTLRRRRYGLLLLIAALVQLLSAWVTFIVMVEYTLNVSRAVSEVLTVQCATLLLILFLVVPALAAVTLAAERRQETDDLLRTALFHPATVVGGKLLAVLATFMLFHIALLPFGAFIYFFAGIELRSLFQSSFLLYTTALAHAAVGMLLSQVLSSPSRAVFAAFVSVALLYGVPSGFHEWELSQGASGALPPPNPVSLLARITAGEADWSTCGQLAFQQGLGVVALAALSFACASLARVPHALGFRRRAKYAEVRRTRGPIPDWGNPVFHREYRLALLSRPAWAISAFLLSIVGAAILTPWSASALNGDWDALDAGTFLLYVLIPLLVVERCGREMEPDLLVHLRLSLLRSEQVLLAMGLAIFCSVFTLIGGTTLGAFIPLLLSHFGSPWGAMGPLPPPELLLLKSFNLIPKVAFAITISFMCVHYYNPRAVDQAVSLVAAYLLIAIGDHMVYGLIGMGMVDELEIFGITFIAVGNLIILMVFATVPACIAMVRLDGVFELQSADDLLDRLEGHDA